MAGAAAGVVVAGFLGLGAAGVSLGAFGYMAHQATKGVWDGVLARRRRVTLAHPVMPALLRLDPWSSHHATLAWDQPDGPSLFVPTLGKSSRLPIAVKWSGVDVQSVGRRMLSSSNLTLGSNTELVEATALLGANAGDLNKWARHRVGMQGRFLGRNKWDDKLATDMLPAYWDQFRCDHLILGRLLPYERLAVEMWLSEDAERIWLEGELKLLEREWRDAERIAKISDDLQLDDEPGTVKGER
jgi:hypothetical protein